MKGAKKKLEKALKKTQELPDNWFGDKQASIEDLPSVKNKRDKVRKNLFIEIETVEFLEKISKKHGVAFTSLANDILTGFVKREMNRKHKK